MDVGEIGWSGIAWIDLRVFVNLAMNLRVL
jgi:hypothetical protein